MVQSASLEILVEGRLAGSGWFASSQGLAFTAAHVVKGRGRIEVISPVAGRLSAQLLATDLGHDLALLKVERLGPPFPYLGMVSVDPGVGERLHIFGAPLNRHGLLLPGWLSNNQTSFEWNDRNRGYTEILPVAAQTPEGLSGGPWVNKEGEVVGLQSGMMAWKGVLMGVAFMTPRTALQSLLRNKQTRKTVSLGAMLAEAWELPVSKGQRPAGKREGLVIRQLRSGGSAIEAGLKQGDMILELEGRPMARRDQLLRRLRQYSAGEQVEVLVRRSAGGEEKVQVTLRLLENF